MCNPRTAWMRMRSTPTIITLSFLPQSLAMEALVTSILWAPTQLLWQPASMSYWNVLFVLIEFTLQLIRYVLSPILTCHVWYLLVNLMTLRRGLSGFGLADFEFFFSFSRGRG